MTTTDNLWSDLRRIGDGIEAKRKREREQAEAAEARKKPRIIARYLTEAGKALADSSLCVTVTETGPRDDDGHAASTISACQVCPATDTQEWRTTTWSYSDQPIWHTVTEAAQTAEHHAREWAETHAEKCRALPVTTT